jgi:hypothetical protein
VGRSERDLDGLPAAGWGSRSRGVRILLAEPAALPGLVTPVRYLVTVTVCFVIVTMLVKKLIT